ncbi:LuxR family transcriptional regulator [Defluviimonas sp. WL0075]|uniref:LuxR family transcriptional regulator n=1 Tax=Albidovulum sediminicola TaxID=2984331 RepID=A0ABT2Z4P7_9RHOB|nr:LuxR family transcriptional regulator [Defluviimonas sp. WL0075]MCV2865741.1 LuxR family transcriptional regulator [Defluviimonas sp. WL0075]
MPDLREQASAIMNAETIDDTWAALAKSLTGYGFDGIIYGLTRARAGNSVGEAEDFLILSNYPSDYLDAFAKSGLFANGPMVKWALENDGVQSWDLIAERAKAGELCDAELRVLELNRRYGILAGYSISFRDTSVKAKGGIGLCARHQDQAHVDAIWRDHGKNIEFLCRLAHMKLSSLPFRPPNRSLSPRQQEVLEWAGEGKTTQDIAILLGVTVATVEKHLRLARHALAAETTAQAVLKASMLNQIFVFRR